MLSKKNRLTKTKDFEKIFEHGEISGNRQFTVRYMKNDLSYPRIAFIVSKKIFKKAVDRNKLKRRMRETVRHNITKISQINDIIIIAKSATKTMDFQQIKTSLLHALNTIKNINKLS